MVNRKDIEDRILHIISYIDQEKTLKPLIGTLKLFSLEELLQLKDFLETGDYKPIYKLVDEKIKKYLELFEEIKQLKIGEKKEKLKQQEQEEQQKEIFDIDAVLI